MAQKRTLFPVENVGSGDLVITILHQGLFHGILNLFDRDAALPRKGDFHLGKQESKLFVTNRNSLRAKGFFHGMTNFLALIFFLSKASFDNCLHDSSFYMIQCDLVR